jgi:hypothetical protein
MVRVIFFPSVPAESGASAWAARQAHSTTGQGRQAAHFSNSDIRELEALGPVVTLPPGGTVELAEAWDLHAGVPDVADEDEIDRHVRPLVK